jgi:hypothetical protein
VPDALIFRGHPGLSQVTIYAKFGSDLVKPRKIKDFIFVLDTTGYYVKDFEHWNLLRSEMRRMGPTILHMRVKNIPASLRPAKVELYQALMDFYARADNMTVGFQTASFRLLCHAYEALRIAASKGTMQPADTLSAQQVWEWATANQNV